MSNYYISKCCNSPTDPGDTCNYCHQKCELVAVIDSPGGVSKDIKQYQEDIKAGVDVSGKTEQIREEFRFTCSIFSDEQGLLSNRVIDRIADWWLQKLSEQRQTILEEVDRLRKIPNYQQGGDYEEDEGFNEALDTVIKIINK